VPLGWSRPPRTGTESPNPGLGISEGPDPEDGEERFIGWSAIEEAASHGHLTILKRLGADPARDDFDSLYQWTRSESDKVRGG
jgi:hypothetical protein